MNRLPRMHTAIGPYFKNEPISRLIYKVLFFYMQGEQLPEKLVVPRLRVHRDWFKGLAEDFIDHSHPDVGAAPDAESQVDRHMQSLLFSLVQVNKASMATQ